MRESGDIFSNKGPTIVRDLRIMRGSRNLLHTMFFKLWSLQFFIQSLVACFVLQADKEVAEVKLEAAKPALAEAEAALQTIKPAHIASVRKLAKPPHLIMRVMDCVLLLFTKKVDPVVVDPDKGNCVKPSWSESLRLMSQGGFLSTLMNFPKVTCMCNYTNFL